jgi:hypothetical protein
MPEKKLASRRASLHLNSNDQLLEEEMQGMRKINNNRKERENLTELPDEII